MDIREGLGYTKTHEWVLREGDLVKVGITAVAAEQLGEIVFVEPPEEGSRLSREEEAGVIESVKAASPLYAPLSGEVTEVNPMLEDSPESVNEAPYENYLYILRMDDPDEFDGLMSPEDYRKFCEEEES
jgi:glycine cleavage system H protein